MVLRLHGAQALDASNEPEFFAIVQALASTAHVPMPRLYVIPDLTPNACVVGCSPAHAALAVTTGLLDLLDRDELAGVIAHELAHIKHRDILLKTVVATLTSSLSRLADGTMWRRLFEPRLNTHEDRRYAMNGLLSCVVAAVGATLVQLTISRTQEFYADDIGAGLTGKPQVLANTLGKLDRWNRYTPMQVGSPATAHLFIINPFSQGTWERLFGTHPPTANRIAYLEALMCLQRSTSGVD